MNGGADAKLLTTGVLEASSGGRVRVDVAELQQQVAWVQMMASFAVEPASLNAGSQLTSHVDVAPGQAGRCKVA